MTSTEFVESKAFLECDLNEPSRSDYYLAQIAAEIVRPNVKKPGQIKTEAFLLKFKQVEERELSFEERAEASMRAWSAAFKPEPDGGAK